MRISFCHIYALSSPSFCPVFYLCIEPVLVASLFLSLNEVHSSWTLEVAHVGEGMISFSLAGTIPGSGRSSLWQGCVTYFSLYLSPANRYWQLEKTHFGIFLPPCLIRRQTNFLVLFFLIQLCFLHFSVGSNRVWGSSSTPCPPNTHTQMLCLWFQRKDHWFCPSEGYRLKKMVSCQLCLRSISTNTPSGSLYAPIFDCLLYWRHSPYIISWALAFKFCQRWNLYFYHFFSGKCWGEEWGWISLIWLFKQKPQYL